jgi:hypothetical protein
MANVLGELFGNIANAIREKTGDTATMKPSDFPAKISAIEGSSPDVRYVTFMSHDGSVEYGKKAVAVGDDCADPIARGVFDTPTKESDEQFNYTFVGWSTEVNGGLDGNALKAVAENRTVYANYISTVRYYTITYYDDDGITVLHTESLPYGSVPNYYPTKDSCSFDGWTPVLSAVTGDTSYTAMWIENVTFAGGSWADIARICDAGEASEYFSLGDTRTISYEYNGTTYDATVEIVAFDFDDKADGSGKAGITVCTTSVTPWTAKKHSSYNYPGSQWPNCDAYSMFNSTIFNTFSTDLKNVIKPVVKLTNGYDGSVSTTFTTTDMVWLPSIREIGSGNVSNYNLVAENGSSFSRYTINKGSSYYLRSGPSKFSVNSSGIVNSTGSCMCANPTVSGTGYVFGFCI